MNNEVFNTIIKEFSRVFRHILPGFVFLVFYSISYPSNCALSSFGTLPSMIIGILIGLIIGNAWYVIHRYTIHNIIDFFIYKLFINKKFESYLHWVCDHIDGYYSIDESCAKMKQHIHFRSAQIIFMFILSEISIIFSIFNEKDSLSDNNSLWMFIVGIILFFASVLQSYVQHRLDEYCVEKYGRKTITQQTDTPDSITPSVNCFPKTP